MSDPNQERVLIWSGEHHAYWRPNSQGYVNDAAGAGVYTRAEFDRIVAGCDSEKKLEARPVPTFTTEEFEHRIDFLPAYDKRAPAPEKNYGIGAMRLRFILIGPLGAVQWMIGTPWYVASARKPGLESIGGNPQRPVGWDLGYHSPKPMYDEQTPMGECDVLTGSCYYDGSGLNADLLIEGFLEGGDKYVWKALEAYYRCTFEDKPWPFDKEGNLL